VWTTFQTFLLSAIYTDSARWRTKYQQALRYQGDSFSIAANENAELTLGKVVNGKNGIRRRIPACPSPIPSCTPEVIPTPAPDPAGTTYRL